MSGFLAPRGCRSPGALLLFLAALAGSVLFLLSRSAPWAWGGAGPAAAANGDTNGDGQINITDPIYLLEWLFLGGPPPVPVRCPLGLPASGQTLCYDEMGLETTCANTLVPGQDARTRAGCRGGAAGRYLADGGTVSDECTGLLWQSVSSLGRAATWSEALRYAQAVVLCNDGAWATSAADIAAHGGARFNDWRLPNLPELASIVDYGKANPAVDPVLTVDPAGHWSSTTFVGRTDEAWCVNFADGGTEPVPKVAGLRVLVVRGGQ